MHEYTNRKMAGQTLASHLKSYHNQKNTIVLALPRGGVPVAYEVAKALSLPLDVFIVRKLGVPFHPELAMGALAPNHVTVFNRDVIHSTGVQQRDIDEVIQKEEAELQRRQIAYRGTKPFPNLNNQTIILIDDGIATGATLRAAIEALHQMKAKKIVVAVPVAPQDAFSILAEKVDDFICPLLPEHFNAVGAHYQDFSQTEDEEVISLLNAANQ